MRIAQFIRTHPKEIETGWEQFAKDLSGAGPDMSVWALRDHLREILVAMADNMESPQSQEEQADKSEGKEPRGGALDEVKGQSPDPLQLGEHSDQDLGVHRARSCT